MAKDTRLSRSPFFAPVTGAADKETQSGIVKRTLHEPPEAGREPKAKEKRVILSVYLTESERAQVNEYLEKHLRISASSWVRMQLLKEGILKS